MKKMIIGLMLFHSGIVFAANNSIEKTEQKRTEFGGLKYEVDKYSHLTPNPRIDITLSCRKSGYRPHKIGNLDIESSKDSSPVYHANNYDLGKFHSNELGTCIGGGFDGPGYTNGFSMPFKVEASCKKVKGNNKGKIDSLTLEGLISLDSVDCKRTIADIFSRLHGQVLNLNDDHPMKVKYLATLKREEERKQEALSRALIQAGEDLKPIELKKPKIKVIKPKK